MQWVFDFFLELLSQINWLLQILCVLFDLLWLFISSKKKKSPQVIKNRANTDLHVYDLAVAPLTH